jgi:hypothetical protein
MGIAQSARKNWPEANRAFNAAVAASPDVADVHFNFGVALVIMERPTTNS